jgi:hypothetical protein
MKKFNDLKKGDYIKSINLSINTANNKIVLEQHSHEVKSVIVEKRINGAMIIKLDSGVIKISGNRDTCFFKNIFNGLIYCSDSEVMTKACLGAEIGGIIRI